MDGKRRVIDWRGIAIGTLTDDDQAVDHAGVRFGVARGDVVVDFAGIRVGRVAV